MNTTRVDSLGFLSIFGSAVVILGIGAKLFGSLPVESYETAQYLWVSAGVSAIALALAIWPSKILRFIFLAVFIAFTAVYTKKVMTVPLVVLAFCQVVCMAVLARSWIQDQVNERRWVKLGIYTLAMIALSLLTWVLAAKMIWWREPQDWASEASAVWYLITGAAILVCLGMWPLTANRFKWGFVFDVAAVSFFLLPSMRMNFQFFHTSYYVGPANLIRQGGWLLWDVPSQYGFLNILLMALIPGVSSWQAFWIIDSSLIFLSACITYVIFRNLMPGLRGVPAAFLSTMASIFFLPGWAPYLAGPTYYPSTGALRFIFPYVLMALIFLNLKRNGARFWSERMLAFGNFIWLFGVLWAVESGVYCTMIWGSILVSVAWGRGIKSVLRIFLTPPALLLAAWGVIALYYKVNLGSFPDPLGYLDFALAFQSGYGALPVNPNGSMWILILMLSGVAYSAYLAVGRAPWLLGGIGGAGAMLVATATYFVARSHENNVIILFPLFMLGAMVALLHIESIPELRRKTWLVRFAFVPFLAIGFIVPLHPLAARQWWSDISSLRGIGSVHDSIPVIPDAAKNLLERAGVRPGDPVVQIYPDVIGSLSIASEAHLSPSPYRDWLPLAPAHQIDTLSLPIQALYMERFMARVPSNGWILTTSPIMRFADTSIPRIANLVFERLSKTHDLVARFEEEGWVLLRYDRKLTP